jgi:eukaryotic-like serine/threonine-protein kinase
MGNSKIMASPRNEQAGASLTPERWQQVKDRLAEILEIEPSQRHVFIDRVCAHDAWLRVELEALLAADDDGGLLDSPVVIRESATTSSDGLSTRIGRRIGAYQIVEEIGAGGMGEVYRAFRADDQYRKEVAIKLLRAGLDSKFVVGRFRNERQLLASLDHPNIARFLDGGTSEESVPYFVMELIEGQPITESCDGNKLATTERLRLFLQVCSAVQYAHQRLIIHRDLKPGNFLVTSEGTP